MGEEIEVELNEGDVVHIRPGRSHQLECLSPTGGKIAEGSTEHYESDSYRTAPGDSQR